MSMDLKNYLDTISAEQYIDPVLLKVVMTEIMDAWFDKMIHGLTSGYMDEKINGLIDKHITEWMDVWINGWTYRYQSTMNIHYSSHIHCRCSIINIIIYFICYLYL